MRGGAISSRSGKRYSILRRCLTRLSRSGTIALTHPSAPRKQWASRSRAGIRAAAALVAALALNGLWVALLLWLVGRWIGAV